MIVLNLSRLITPLGAMVAIADEKVLYLLAFEDSKDVQYKIDKIQENKKIVSGKSAPIRRVESELARYFAGTLKEFTVPLYLYGSSFQKQVWNELQKIPYGHTQSYADIACAIEREKAYRAVGHANSANNFFIVVPCHRVINAGGMLGGYGGGIERKKWLINHEENY